jgi:hypothetical protein
MHLANGTNRTGLHQFHGTAVVVSSMDLGSDLRYPTLLPGEILNHTRFGNRPRQRFFAVHVLPAPQGRSGSHSVCMIRSRNHDRVQIVPIDHMAEILILPGFRMLQCRGCQTPAVNIANRNDILAADRLEIRGGPTGHANHSYVEPIIGTEHPSPGRLADPATGSGGQGGTLEKGASGQLCFHKMFWVR